MNVVKATSQLSHVLRSLPCIHFYNNEFDKEVECAGEEILHMYRDREKLTGAAFPPFS